MRCSRKAKGGAGTDSSSTRVEEPSKPLDSMLRNAGGEEARADAERAEVAVIEQWLPALASEETVRGWIQGLLDGGAPADNPGRLMGMLMKDHKEELDGKMAKELCAAMCE